jgi:hypothetical protein
MKFASAISIFVLGAVSATINVEINNDAIERTA